MASTECFHSLLIVIPLPALPLSPLFPPFPSSATRERTWIGQSSKSAQEQREFDVKVKSPLSSPPLPGIPPLPTQRLLPRVHRVSSYNVISSVSSANIYLAAVVGCLPILALFTVLITYALIFTRDVKLDKLLDALCMPE